MKGNPIVSYLSKGWEEVSRNIADAVIATVITGVSFLLVVLILRQFIPIVGSLLLPWLTGLCETGYAYYFLRRVKGETPEFKDLFVGFTRFWKTVAGASYFLSILSLQFLLFFSQHWIIVGIVGGVSFLLAILYIFTFIAVADGEKNVWAALEKSRTLITPKYKDYFVLGLVLLGLNALGGIIVVGLFLTLPTTACAYIRAYLDEVGACTVFPASGE